MLRLLLKNLKVLIFLSNTISKEDFVSILKETLEEGKDFSFNPTGISMIPMLNGTTDTVVLTKKGDSLKKYDVVLYLRRRDNAIVLHRIMSVENDCFTMSGDNQLFYDKDIPFSDVLAVVKSFTRNGKCYSVESLFYRIFIRYIMVRKLFIRLSNKLKFSN